MKAKHLDLFLAATVGISAYQLYPIWIARGGDNFLPAVARSEYAGPSVYRVIIPGLSRALAAITGADLVGCMIFLFVLSSIGFYYSLKYLSTTWHEGDRSGIVSFLGCELFLLFILHEASVGDFATAALVALSLALLARGRMKAYLLLFPIAVLNRETSFLLILVYAAFFFPLRDSPKYWKDLAYQVCVFLIIQSALRILLSNAAGLSYNFHPVEVLGGYLANLPRTLFLMLILGVTAWLIKRNLSRKPMILQWAIAIMFPALLFLHLFVGEAFEIRVFAEAFPPAFLLAIYSRIVEPATTKNQLQHSSSPRPL